MTDDNMSLVIGTGLDCFLCLDDEYVSTRHARVWVEDDGQAWIEDLGSTNGTWIGGGPLAGGRRIYGPTRIGPGVIIHVGHTDIPWADTQRSRPASRWGQREARRRFVTG